MLASLRLLLPVFEPALSDVIFSKAFSALAIFKWTLLEMVTGTSLMICRPLRCLLQHPLRSPAVAVDDGGDAINLTFGMGTARARFVIGKFRAMFFRVDNSGELRCIK